MRYIKIEGDFGYCGTDFTEYVAFEENTTDDDINAYAEEMVNQEANEWEHLAIQDIDEDDYDNPEEYEECCHEAILFYYESVCNSWEEVTYEEWEENNGIEAY